jgi:hypothetical protein
MNRKESRTIKSIRQQQLCILQMKLSLTRNDVSWETLESCQVVLEFVVGCSSSSSLRLPTFLLFPRNLCLSDSSAAVTLNHKEKALQNILLTLIEQQLHENLQERRRMRRLEEHQNLDTDPCYKLLSIEKSRSFLPLFVTFSKLSWWCHLLLPFCLLELLASLSVQFIFEFPSSVCMMTREIFDDWDPPPRSFLLTPSSRECLQQKFQLQKLIHWDKTKSEI